VEISFRANRIRHAARVDFSPSSASGSPSRLEQFRTRPKRQPLHPLESLLLLAVAIHLIFLPWAVGAMVGWAQLASLALAMAGFAIALLPRNYTEEFTGGGAFRLYTGSKLLRFPIFWAGLALLAYIAVQGLNPAWVYVEEKGAWWMQSRPHVAWLPTGTDNPFRLGGPWRTLIVYASAWLVVCSIWIGFTRRRSLQLLFVVLAAHGFLLGTFALVQRLTGNGRMFWFLKVQSANSFFGPFVYKNHAGAYLLVVLVIAVGLAAWFYLRGLRRMEKSNPAGVFVFIAAVLSVDIVVSFARGATISLLLFLFVAIIAFLVLQWQQPSLLRKPIVSAMILLGLALFMGIGFKALSADKAWTRLTRLADEEDTSITSRQIATRASWDMLKANLPWGSGAGSFRFVFPLYQQNYPEIFLKNKRRLFWDHAHNDFMEIPAELGLFGVAVIFFGFCYWLLRLARFYFWENPFSLIAALGVFVVMAHAWTDFLFENPAILVTWCALWPALVLWTEFEEKRQRS
jgi:O-antigen ligase